MRDKKEIEKEMNKIIENNKYNFCDEYDMETIHIDADALLCNVLRDLGYNELVDWFESLEKWYA